MKTQKSKKDNRIEIAEIARMAGIVRIIVEQ